MKLANCVLMAASIGLAAACTSLSPGEMPAGTIAFACSPMLDTPDECYARVVKLCPHGFTILAESRSSVMAFDPFQRTLYLRCSNGEG